MSTIYGAILIVLGCWAAFTTSKIMALPRAFRKHRVLIIIGIAFVVSCIGPGFALVTGTFAPWMLVPLGVCYLCLLPEPCYFSWANHGWVRKGRTVLFVLAGVALIAAGLGFLPLRWFGM